MPGPDRESLSQYEMFRMLQEENPESAEESFNYLKRAAEAMLSLRHQAEHVMEAVHAVGETETCGLTGTNEPSFDLAYLLGLSHSQVNLLTHFVEDLLTVTDPSPTPDHPPHPSHTKDLGGFVTTVTGEQLSQFLMGLRDSEPTTPEGDHYGE